MVSIGDSPKVDEMSDGLDQIVAQNGNGGGFFSWKNYWLVPLHSQRLNEEILLGILGIGSTIDNVLGEDQKEAVTFLAERASTALEDHMRQQEIFKSIETLSPQIDLIQRLRAASRYGGTDD